jgi:hypothetical protein
MRRILLVTLVLLGLTSAPAEAKINLQPFMGWSSWSVESSTRATYGTNWLTEGNIRNAADAMAAKIASAGYTSLNIDSGWNATLNWQSHFDGNGIPEADSTRFPSGLPSLSSYVHGKGLKLGLYMPAGLDHGVYDANLPIAGTSCHTRDIAVNPLTATNKWGSHWKIDYGTSCAQSYISSIVAKFASWNVDFIKVDGVTQDNVPDMRAWSTAIDRSGRAMWLTASAWPVDRAAAPGLRPYANSVRIDTDVECYCGTISTWTSSVDKRWADLPNWLNDVGPNFWPDLDAMPISNNRGQAIQDGINDVERQSVMTFWSMASSPLYVGGDIYFMDSTAISILTNPEVIAVDQAGVLPQQVTGGNLQKWRKRMPDGSWVVAVYNLGSSSANITVNWSDISLSGSHPVRDLAARRDLGAFTNSWTATGVPAHGSRLIKVS